VIKARMQIVFIESIGIKSLWRIRVPRLSHPEFLDLLQYLPRPISQRFGVEF